MSDRLHAHVADRVATPQAMVDLEPRSPDVLSERADARAAGEEPAT